MPVVLLGQNHRYFEKIEITEYCWLAPIPIVDLCSTSSASIEVSRRRKKNDQQMFLHSRSHSIISIQDGDVAQQLMFHSIFLHESSRTTRHGKTFSFLDSFFSFEHTKQLPAMAYAYLFKYIIIGDTGACVSWMISDERNFLCFCFGQVWANRVCCCNSPTNVFSLYMI